MSPKDCFITRGSLSTVKSLSIHEKAVIGGEFMNLLIFQIFVQCLDPRDAAYGPIVPSSAVLLKKAFLQYSWLMMCVYCTWIVCIGIWVHT